MKKTLTILHDGLFPTCFGAGIRQTRYYSITGEYRLSFLDEERKTSVSIYRKEAFDIKPCIS